MNLHDQSNDLELNLQSMDTNEIKMACACAYKVKNHLERHSTTLEGLKYLSNISEINMLISAYEQALTNQN